MFIVLFTQIIHRKQTNTNNKENNVNFTVQYPEKYSRTVQQSAYITTAIMLASGYPGLKDTALLYSIQYCIKGPKHNLL